ncbi:MAG: hypothetical protein ACJ786_12710 [Catenulispora sp.]
MGDVQRAAAIHTDVLIARRRFGEPVATADTLVHLADALHAAGRAEQADQRRDQALAELSGIVDPATDTLRSRLLDTAASDR